MTTAWSVFAVRVKPPASARIFKVLNCSRSLVSTNPPGLPTAPRTYTTPAWGTVTTSPAPSVMLFLVLPASMSSNKLMVMVSTGTAGEGMLPALMDFCGEVLGADKSGGSAAVPLAGEVEGAAAAVRGFVSGSGGFEPAGE